MTQFVKSGAKVIHSLMPKGVEHYRVTEGDPYTVRVIHSLMPKGVEHFGRDRIDAIVDPVIHSLMPKGVEHRHELGYSWLRLM